MIDCSEREIAHLQLSLTDHRNPAWRYYFPAIGWSGGSRIDPALALSIVHWLSQCHGVRHVRLIGGEPLLYPGLIRLIRSLTELGTLREITLTTNAQTLAPTAEALRTAGLSRVNVMLHTLRPDRFARGIQGGDVARTLVGIERARKTGLAPVKINVVVQRGLNDDEVPEIAEWGLAHGCVLRFLEVAPIGPTDYAVDRHLVPMWEILDRLSDRFELQLIPQSIGGPATDYAATAPGLRGVIGVVARTTHPFCSSYGRLRVTSRGYLMSGVQEQSARSLMPAWDGRGLDLATAERVLATILGDRLNTGARRQNAAMMSVRR